MFPHILTQRSLTLYAGGVPLSIHADDSRWERAMQLMRQPDPLSADELVQLMQPAQAVQRALDLGLGGEPASC